jgi:hypothetical protein
MTFIFRSSNVGGRTDPPPSCPEIRDLMREVMAALLWNGAARLVKTCHQLLAESAATNLTM